MLIKGNRPNKSPLPLRRECYHEKGGKEICENCFICHLYWSNSRFAVSFKFPACGGQDPEMGLFKRCASLDPYSFDTHHNVNFARHIHDSSSDKTLILKVEPCLATSWKVIEPTVWRFYLRRGVKFQNGNPFTADDVVASIKRVTHPNSPLKGHYARGEGHPQGR